MPVWASVAIWLLLLGSQFCYATTWDEPWHEGVVKNADIFIRAKVMKNDKTQVKLQVVKQLAGEKAPESLVVNAFSMLHLGSFSPGNDEMEFHLGVGREYYFFLKKVDGKDAWALATPTAGYAATKDGNVFATYRHSYHQALVAEDMYEPSMTAIFQFLHGQKYDGQYVRSLFQKYLTQPPQETPKPEDGERGMLFFQQHVALECFYYFGKPEDYELLDPFLKSGSEHVRISAVRALSRIDTPASRQRLWDLLTSKGDGFSRVMAVWGLKRLDAREYLPKLREFATHAPEDETGFGGNIMDPRVGTRFPRSVKAACEQLIEEWSEPKPTTRALKSPSL